MHPICAELKLNEKRDTPPHRMSEPRLRKPMDERLASWYNRILRPEAISSKLSQGLLVDKAHVVMLVEQGILSRDHGAKILQSLAEIEALGANRFSINPSLGDEYVNIESYLFKAVGFDVAGGINTGRSRNDRSGTVRRLIVRNAVFKVMQGIHSLQTAVQTLAGQHVATLMPGYTHLQHAQPITFGFYLMCVLDQLTRDFQRLKETYGRVNLSPLGAAALCGTRWPLNQERTRQLLGFDGLVRNAKDAVFLLEYESEFIANSALLMTHLGLLANDLYVWSSTEFGMVELADQFCDTSSIMPQKKNPRALEVVKANAGFVMGMPAVAFCEGRMCSSTDADLLFGPNLADLVFPPIAESLTLMAGVLETLIVKDKVMRRMASEDWSTLVELADEIVARGLLNFRQAHAVCGALTRLCLEKGISPRGVNSDLLNEASTQILGRPLSLTTEEIQRQLDPEVFVHTRITKGSTNPKEVEIMIEDAARTLREQAAWMEAVASRLQHSQNSMKEAVNLICST